MYLAEKSADVDGFDFLGFWHREGNASTCPTTGKILAPADMPYLAVIAGLFHAIDGTSCQAERNFSSLAHLLGDLPSNSNNILPANVERMMFARLNKQFIEEVIELDAAVKLEQARAAKSAAAPVAGQQSRGGAGVDIVLSGTGKVAGVAITCVFVCVKFYISSVLVFG